MSLDEKTLVGAGAGSGIGRATAHQFVDRSGTVSGAERDDDIHVTVNCSAATDLNILLRFASGGLSVESTANMIPPGRLAESTDVATAVVVPASEEATPIAGPAVEVDRERGS